MKRNPLVVAVKLAITGALASTLVACGGGSGSGSAGSVSVTAAGTSVGPVSGFGSVYVNGTRFATNGSVDSDDGIEREGQLEKGMVLQVNGTWDDRGQGEASSVGYDDTLRGPLTSASWNDVDRIGTLDLLGQNVMTDGQTVFKGASPADIAANPAGFRVRISGWRMDNGNFRASFVGARAIGIDFDDNNEVEIEGIVANLDPAAETFTINGFSINYESAQVDDDFDLADLANGIAVEVEGELSGNTIIASEIDDEDDLFDDDDDVEISGAIYGYDSASLSFSINGVKVQINGGTEFDDGVQESNLADGLLVKVEGEFRNGVLVAEEIEGRDADAELDGVIESIDLTNETLLVSGLRVVLTGNTLIEDDDSDDDDDNNTLRTRDIESLNVGDFLEVEGRQNNTDGGFLEAYKIEREDDSDDEYELEARVTGVGSTTLTVMNLELQFGSFDVPNVSAGDEIEVEYRFDGGAYVIGDLEVEDDD